MATQSVSVTKTSIASPVIALALYAVASGYLMSLIPLILSDYGLNSELVGWLASAFYVGLFLGALAIETVVAQLGYKRTFIICLLVYIMTMGLMLALPTSYSWLLARFVAGLAVAGIFVVVESWLLHGEESSRAKRLGLYMASLYGGSSLGQLGIGTLEATGALPFILVASVLVGAICVLAVSRSYQPDETHAAKLSVKQIVRLNHAAIIGCIVSGLTLGAVYGLMPLELANRGIEHQSIGKLMAVIILGGMFIQPLVPKLSRYLGRTLLMGLFCLIGTAAIASASMSVDNSILAISLFVLGVAAFPLYPIAINLACEKMAAHYIVSITQVMLISYSIGSISGPLIANYIMENGGNLLEYLFGAFISTCIYMLFKSAKQKPHVFIGE